jgi:hypothetical protein
MKALAVLFVSLGLAACSGSDDSGKGGMKHSNNHEGTPAKTTEGGGAHGHEKGTPVPAGGNTTCPVTGDPATAEVFEEVDGKKIYLCCSDCRDAVKKDPKGMMAKAYPGTK